MDKKKTLRGIVFTAMLVLAATVLAVQTETYDIDPVHSFACFKVGHLGVGSVHGCFTDISGAVVVDESSDAGSSVNVVIQTTSVNTFVAQRDEHLRTADFFDVANFPTMEFKSREVVKLDGGAYRVTGDFTLHGVTNSIRVDARMVGRGDDPMGNTRGAFESSFSINRSDYGMDKMIPAAGDKVEITLAFEGILKK
jgi:polyisoprenoid-binding protein YceI